MPRLRGGTLLATVLAAGGKKAAPDPLLTNLVAWWTMDEESGTRADSTGRGNDLSAVVAPGYAAGVLGNCASLSVANRLQKTSNNDLKTGNVDFTISLWVKQAGSISAGIVMQKSQTQWTNMEYLFYCHTNANGFWFNVYDAANADKKVVGNLTRQADTWYHVVGYHNATTHKIGMYINGSAMTEVAIDAGGVRASDQPLQFSDGSGGGNFLVDEVGIWRRLLTPAEVGRLYNGGAGITYPFDGAPNPAGDGYIVNDATRNFVFEGDSLTYGVSMSAREKYPRQCMDMLASQPAFVNCGHPQDLTATMLDEFAADVATKIAAGKTNWLVLWGGTNDCIHNETVADVQTTYDNLAAICSAARTAGFDKIVLLTLMPGDAYWMTESQRSNYETRRQALNTLIRNGYAGIADGLADIGSDATIGAAGAQTNALYFLDGLHLTPSGYRIVAGLVKDVIEPA